MTFDGSADLSGKEPVIRAKTHLLQSNLQALHLTPEPIEASADFDVDATGNTIDDFLGKALLHNIDVTRGGPQAGCGLYKPGICNRHGTDGKQLLVESNDFSAIVEGNISFLSCLIPCNILLGNTCHRTSRHQRALQLIRT